VRRRRLWSILVVPFGLVAGHVLGYRLALLIGSDPAAAGGHGHLTAIWVATVPLSVAVVVRAVIGGLRAELAPVRFVPLAGAQIGAYVAMELVEHAAAGISLAESVRDPSLALGIVAQVAVAWLLWRVVRSVHEIAARFTRDREAMATSSPRVWRPVPLLRGAARVTSGSISQRGPPLAVAA
jgi:hypothetical protein